MRWLDRDIFGVCLQMLILIFWDRIVVARSRLACEKKITKQYTNDTDLCLGFSGRLSLGRHSTLHLYRQTHVFAAVKHQLYMKKSNSLVYLFSNSRRYNLQKYHGCRAVNFFNLVNRAIISNHSINALINPYLAHIYRKHWQKKLTGKERDIIHLSFFFC